MDVLAMNLTGRAQLERARVLEESHIMFAEVIFISCGDGFEGLESKSNDVIDGTFMIETACRWVKLEASPILVGGLGCFSSIKTNFTDTLNFQPASSSLDDLSRV